MGYRSLVAAAMSAALLTLGTVGPPEARAEAPLEPAFTVTPDSGEAFDEVEVSGSCLVDGYTGTPSLVLQGAEDDDLFVDYLLLKPDGTFDQTITIPDVAASGNSYDLTVPGEYDLESETTLLDCGSDQNLYVVALDLDRGTGQPGEQVNATGVCPGNSGLITILFGGSSTTVESSTGEFDVSLTVPDVEAGSYDVTTSCNGHAAFEVLAPILPTLVLDPVSAEGGRDVSATGTCPRYTEYVDVYFEESLVASDSVDSSTGAFGPVTFPVPDVEPGFYDDVTTSCGGHASFEVLAPVLPSLVLDPVSALGGSGVTATGTCPRYTEYVDVFFEDSAVTSASVDYWTGAFGPVGFPIPDVPPGSYAVGTDCGGEGSFEVLDVEPVLALDPTSGHVGDGVTATGTCPRYSESFTGSVDIFLDDRPLGSATVDASTGKFGPVGLLVPPFPPGAYVATTDCGGEAPFEVLDADPTLRLDPVSGHIGGDVAATGTCPIHSGSVEIRFGTTFVGFVTVDPSTGEFGPVGFPVPRVPPGSYDVTTGCGGAATFEVRDVEPTLDLDPTSGQVNDDVTAAGTCPVTSGSVEVFFDGTRVGSATVDSSTGEFGSVDFPVPDVPTGVYRVTTTCGAEALFDVLPFGVIPATLDLDPARGELGVDVTASGTCSLDHPDVTLLLDGRTVATKGAGPESGEFEVVFPMLGVQGPTHTVSTSCGASEEFTLLLPSPSATSPGPSARGEPRPGGSPGAQARPNRPRSQLPTPRRIDTPQGIRILVPDLTGLTEDEVITALGDDLMLVGRTGDVGVVTRQLPLAGTLVEPASAVSILLAEPELAPESGTSRFPLAVLTVLVGALIGALLSGERVRRRRARERRWVENVRTELETAEPALQDVPDGSAPGLDVRIELQRDPKHL